MQRLTKPAILHSRSDFMGLFDMSKKKAATPPNTPDQDAFICSKCGKTLAQKYMYMNHICVNCAPQSLSKYMPDQKPAPEPKQVSKDASKNIRLCYCRKNAGEWWTVELQFNKNNEILLVDIYYWPAVRGGSNGGESITKLDADYFTKNSIDDFIAFLKTECKLAEEFHQDFSILKERDDIKALFGNTTEKKMRL